MSATRPWTRDSIFDQVPELGNKTAPPLPLESPMALVAFGGQPATMTANSRLKVARVPCKARRQLKGAYAPNGDVHAQACRTQEEDRCPPTKPLCRLGKNAKSKLDRPAAS